jgi:hypothetical protein
LTISWWAPQSIRPCRRLAVANLPPRITIFLSTAVGLGSPPDQRHQTRFWITILGKYLLHHSEKLELINCLRYEKMTDFRNKYRNKDASC